MGLSNYLPSSRISQSGVCTSTTRPASPEQTKTCTKCSETKTLDCFYKQTAGKYGVAAHCKLCHSNMSISWAKRNPETVKKINSKYRQNNTEKLKERHDEWYKKNREYRLSQKKQYRSEHREELNEKVKDWYKKNPHKYSEYSGRRRARLTAADRRKISSKDWDSVLFHYRNCCAYCGSNKDLTMDHVVPLYRGGRHSIGNLVPACMSCNISKGTKLIVEWRKTQWA